MDDDKIRISIPNWGCFIFVAGIFLFLIFMMGYIILSNMINWIKVGPDGIEFRMVDWEVPSKPGTRKEKIRWEEIQGLLYVTRMSGTADVDPGMHMESDYILLTKRFNLSLGNFGQGDVFGSRLTPRNVPKIVEMIKKGSRD